jgi:hypothetical protein
MKKVLPTSINKEIRNLKLGYINDFIEQYEIKDDKGIRIFL